MNKLNQRVQYVSVDQVAIRYLDGLGWYSGVWGLLQVGGQVLIHVLKYQSQFGFSVSPRDRAHIKQPRRGGTGGEAQCTAFRWKVPL